MMKNDRLKDARARAGFESASEAARRFGWPPSTYLGHENGSRGFGSDEAATYARAFKVDAAWLLFGSPGPSAALPAMPPSDDQALIPVFDIQASAGPGVIAPDHEMIAESVSLPVTYLRHITTTHPRHLCLIGVKGDSMLPTLKQDDLVMLDTTKTSLGYDGLFVLEMDGALHVKRVTRGSQAGMVRIISDNAAHYPTYERAAHEIQVKGKVVWKGVKE